MTGILATLLLVIQSGCGGGSSASAAPSKGLTPSRDPAVIRFRAVLDTDMRGVSFAVDTEACKTRSNCISELSQIKGATDTLLADLGSDSPAAVGTLVENLRLAAQHFNDQVAAALVIVRQPNSDFFAAGARLTVRDLYLAAAYLDCWPAQPVNPGNEGGYSCA